MKRISYIISIFLLFLSAEMLHSQSVGINTLHPGADLEIKGLGNSTDKTLRVVNSSNIEILTMLDNGYLGIGQISPSVRLDLRGTSNQAAIGIGTTKKLASIVKGGAIRYMAGTKELHYSDGDQWLRLQNNLLRPCLIAPNNYVGGTYPSNATTRVTGFVATYDSHGAFDPTNSTYTIPVDGLYVLSFTMSFDRNVKVNANTYIEARWVASNGRSLKCIKAYPESGFGQTGLTCSGTLQLSLGDTVWPEVWHNLGGTKVLRVYGYSSRPDTDKGFNQISIFAQ